MLCFASFFFKNYYCSNLLVSRINFWFGQSQIVYTAHRNMEVLQWDEAITHSTLKNRAILYIIVSEEASNSWRYYTIISQQDNTPLLILKASIAYKYQTKRDTLYIVFNVIIGKSCMPRYFTRLGYILLGLVWLVLIERLIKLPARVSI